MEQESEKEFILATCLQGGKFELKESLNLKDFSQAVEAAEIWKNKTSIGGDALVIEKSSMEIHWPERLKGKKVESW